MIKRFLIISPHYPLPEHSGMNIRTMNFVRTLKTMGEVDLAFISGNRINEGSRFFDNETLLEKVDDSHCDKTLFNRIIRIISGRPWMIRELSPKSKNELFRQITEKQYDAIICRYIHSAWSLLELPLKIRQKIIIDIDDIITDSLYDSNVEQAQSIRNKIRNRYDWLQLKRFQSKCLKFGSAVFSSSEDAKNNADPKASNVFVIPNVSCQISKNNGIGKGAYDRRRTLLFVGSLGYKPNVDGLLWFLTEILPGALKVIPALQLLVVGRNPGNDVKEACKAFDNIQLYSNVSDIEKYYAMSGCCIVPILSGGGTRIKILESGLLGVPVISTPLGAYGLEARDNENILLFRDADEFANNLLKLDDPRTYTQIASAMLDHILINFSPEVFERQTKEAVNFVMNSN